jgi:hypothetical protein
MSWPPLHEARAIADYVSARAAVRWFVLAWRDAPLTRASPRQEGQEGSEGYYISINQSLNVRRRAGAAASTPSVSGSPPAKTRTG